MARRPFLLELALGGTIPDLLAPERTDRVPPVMPHDGCGAEPDSPAGVLNSPAEVDVVPGDTKPSVESPQGGQDFVTEGHVAARDVLGSAV